MRLSVTYGTGVMPALAASTLASLREQREAAREVMRYAGPRMLRRHPILAITHLLDGRRPAPKEIPRRRARIAP